MIQHHIAAPLPHAEAEVPAHPAVALRQMHHLPRRNALHRICPEEVDMNVPVAGGVAPQLEPLQHGEGIVGQGAGIGVDIVICHGKEVIAVMPVGVLHFRRGQAPIGEGAVAVDVALEPQGVFVLEEDGSLHGGMSSWLYQGRLRRMGACRSLPTWLPCLDYFMFASYQAARSSSTSWR